MPTNISYFASQTNLLGIAQASQQYTDGLMFLLVLVALYAMAFVIFKSWDTRVAFVATAFVGLLLGFFMFMVDLSTSAILATQIVLFVVALLLAMFRVEL